MVTTLHDVKTALFRNQRVSPTSLAVALLAGIFAVSTDWGRAALCLGFAVVFALFRYLRPIRRLTLDLGTRTLDLDVDASSAGAAKLLVQAIDSADVAPEIPPTLP